MSIQSEIDRLAAIKAQLKSAINGAAGSVVGDVFADYPAAITSGKASVAAAITDKGVQTAADATFQQMADNIKSIQTGSGALTINNSNNLYLFQATAKPGELVESTNSIRNISGITLEVRDSFGNLIPSKMTSERFSQPSTFVVTYYAQFVMPESDVYVSGGSGGGN